MRQRGFTMIGILFLVAGLGVAMAALGAMWHTVAQREKERELLFVGDQFRRAIEGFWKAPASGARRLPKSLDELLADPRFPHTVRHLRRVWRDPMTGEAEWGVVKAEDGGITAVYSLSEQRPLKTGNFPALYEDFKDAETYQDWVFFFDAAKLESATGAQVKPGGAASP